MIKSWIIFVLGQIVIYVTLDPSVGEGKNGLRRNQILPTLKSTVETQRLLILVRFLELIVRHDCMSFSATRLTSHIASAIRRKPPKGCATRDKLVAHHISLESITIYSLVRRTL